MQRSIVFFLLFAAATSRSAAAERNESALPLVDIRSIDPTIVVELRYASSHNFTGHRLYPEGACALARPEVASALTIAQGILKRYQFGLKLWDALQNNDYVANPTLGIGSLHTWGVAVDATLVDAWNRPVRMPSDFDDFTPAAMWRYTGRSPEVRAHVRLLQMAMQQAGFWGLRTEWWHFTLAHWRKYLPAEKAKYATHVFGTRWEGKL